MDRVFRIRQWKSGGMLMPNRWSEFHKNNRLLFDEERTYNNKIKQLKRQSDKLNSEYMRFAFTCEEFINGTWVLIQHYPEDFDPTKVLGK